MLRIFYLCHACARRSRFSRHQSRLARSIGLAPRRSRIGSNMRVIPPDLIAEHARLMEQSEALEREHEALHEKPHDRKAHAAHRAKLRTHIQALHAHALRWQEVKE